MKKNKTVVRSNQRSLLIKNLAPNIEISQLHDAFGEIISCKIQTYIQIVPKVTEKRFVTRNYGYVQFRNLDDAKKAVENLKRVSINGRPVEIQPFYGNNPEYSFVEFYIRNLPLEFKDEDLKNLCDEFGKSISYKIFTDEKGKSEQMAFCVMENRESAVKAFIGLNGREIGVTTIMCYRAISKEERKSILEEWIKPKNEKIIYVKNFDEKVTDDELAMIFFQFGLIESAKAMRDGNGNSKKFGFVCFETEQQANEYIQQSPLIQIHGKQCYAMPIARVIMNKLSEANIEKSSGPQQDASNSQQNASSSQQNGFDLRKIFDTPQSHKLDHQLTRPPHIQSAYQLPAQFDINPILKNEIIHKYPNNAILLQSLSDMSIVQANKLAINQQLFKIWIEHLNNQFQLENIGHPNVLSEVISPVTEAKFTLVRNEISQSITNLSLALDYEGYFLDLARNSLSTIHISEIFDDSYDVRTNDKPPNVGQKPEFIILAPFSKKVVHILSSILNNPNAMILQQ